MGGSGGTPSGPSIELNAGGVKVGVAIKSPHIKQNILSWPQMAVITKSVSNPSSTGVNSIVQSLRMQQMVGVRGGGQG